MREEQLKELIEKYNNGESSPEEEKILREYFAGDDIISGYEAEKDIFSYYTSAAEAEAVPAPSDDLEQRILRSIDKYDNAWRSRLFTRRYLIPLSLAASLLIIIGSYFFFIHKSEPSDTFSDPVIAYAETIKILNEVSVRLNKGTDALRSIGKISDVTRKSIESIDRSASIISGSIERIRIIDKLSETDVRTKKTNNK
jgi:hypothetical protein